MSIEERIIINQPFLRAFEWKRKEENMTQGEFANHIGIPASRLSEYKSGRSLVTQTAKDKLIRAFRGTLYTPYLDGDSPYMLTENVPDDAVIRDMRRKNPDFEQLEKYNQTKKMPADDGRTPEKIISELEALRSDLALELQEIRLIKYELTHEREVLQQITQQLTAELHAIRGSYDIPSAPIHMVADSDKKPK